MSNANEPAFPFVVQDIGKFQVHEPGLTKREEFAKAAMQGLCANPTVCIQTSVASAIASWATEIADATLAELERTHG